MAEGELRADSAPIVSEAEESDGLPFLVVGVGASAGGLEAYTELLERTVGEPRSGPPPGQPSRSRAEEPPGPDPSRDQPRCR